jgi:hypothetical protein
MRRVIGRIGAGGLEMLAETTAEDERRMAEIIATRTTPGDGLTDRAFMEGFLTGHDDGLVGESAQDYREKYRAATGSYPSGRRYMSGVARFPGDPRAWVDSMADVRKICEEDNLSWQYAGKVLHEAREPEADSDDKPYAVAPDLIEKRLKKAVEANPDLKHQPKKLADEREKIAKKAAGRMARK